MRTVCYILPFDVIITCKNKSFISHINYYTIWIYDWNSLPNALRTSSRFSWLSNFQSPANASSEIFSRGFELTLFYYVINITNMDIDKLGFKTYTFTSCFNDVLLNLGFGMLLIVGRNAKIVMAAVSSKMTVTDTAMAMIFPLLRLQHPCWSLFFGCLPSSRGATKAGLAAE